MTLTGPQMGRLVDVLVLVFENYGALNFALSTSVVGIGLPLIVQPGPMDEVLLAVVHKAARESWLPVILDVTAKKVGRQSRLFADAEAIFSEAARNRRAGRHVGDRRQIPVTLLYCHVVHGAAPISGAELLGERLEALYDKLAAIIESGGHGVVAWRQNEGFLATFTSPSLAVDAALALQRHTEAIANAFGTHPVLRLGYGLGLRVMRADNVVGPTDPYAAITRAIAAIADHGQILMSAAVFDTVNGAALSVPPERLSWASHGDCMLRANGGEVRRIFEVADVTVRKPIAPERAEGGNPGEGTFTAAGYINLRRLTHSGPTVVYQADKVTDEGLEPVAIKVLLSQLGLDKAENKAFLAPARALQKISHPGLIKIREVRDDELPYFVMDWIDGSHLDEAMDAYGPPNDTALTTLEPKLRLASKVCEALAEAHDNQILHGDLKPSNIVVRASDGQPVILDFGQYDWVPGDAADSTLQGAVGTPLYVAPELVTGIIDPHQPRDQNSPRGDFEAPTSATVTATSDIYSLGALLYDCIVGHPPFNLQNRQAVLDAQVNADPPLPRVERPGFNLDLEAVILKAMEKHPSARYQTADALNDDLQRVARGERVEARPGIYDNMMMTPATSAMRKVEEWSADGRITNTELGRLRRAFDPLLRSGPSAVGESRLTHVSIVALYLLGALLVSGLFFFLVKHAAGVIVWEFRIAVGIAIPVVTAIIWLLLRNSGRFRAAFAIGVLSISSLWLAVTNTLYEFTPQAAPLSYHTGCSLIGDDGGRCTAALENVVELETPIEDIEPQIEASADEDITDVPEDDLTVIEEVVAKVSKYVNWQVFLGLFSALVWARFVSIRSGTMTLATMSATLLAATYLVGLDLIGWRYFLDRGAYYELGIWLIPLALVSLLYPGTSRALGVTTDGVDRNGVDPSRVRWMRRLALPFVNMGTLVLIVALTLLAIDGPRELVKILPADGQNREITSALLFVVAGGFFYLAADTVAKKVFPDAVLAYWLLYYLGVFYIIFGLLAADYLDAASPVSWMPTFAVEGLLREVTAPLVLALVLSVSLIFESARINSRGVMAVGVALVVLVLWYVEFNFLPQDQSAWSYFLIAAGSIGLLGICIALWKPDKRADIDDVGERLVRRNTHVQT